MANRYSNLLEFLENSNSHSVLENKGKIKFITLTYSTVVEQWPYIPRFDGLRIAGREKINFNRKFYKIDQQVKCHRNGQRPYSWKSKW